MRFFDKYTGFFRRLKPLYALYNLLNYRNLIQNKAIYAKYGLKRPVWYPLSSKHLKNLEPGADRSTESMDTFWNEKGFYKINNLLNEDRVSNINRLIENAITEKKLDFNYTQTKILFAYKAIPELKEIIYDQKITGLLSELMGDEVIPFQSINFIYGSEQKAHSDSIHMSTYPKGGLIAIWIALDDTDDDNGPLFYYPGSHKWPYVTNAEIGASTGVLFSPNPNRLYENYLAELIKEKEEEPSVFHALKGDALVWHANLVHGGMPHTNRKRTRRSMVIHYFRKDVICYHEISQRPAIIEAI